MDELTPLVSVCVPTYNGQKYLLEALNSVKNQTYKNIELVISDNNSTDETTKIIKEFIDKSDITVTFVNNNILGIGSNWNNCITHSKGKFIKFLFQDDVLMAECIEKMLKPFKDPKLGMSYCNKELIGNPSPTYQLESDALFDFFKDFKAKEFIGHESFYSQPRNKIGEPPCLLIKKSVFDTIGHYNTKLKQSLDYEFSYRLAQKFEVKSVNEKLVQFRIHDNQTSNKNSKSIILDSYLLPLLTLKNHFWSLHYKSKLLVFYKLVSGLLRYNLKK